MTVSPQRSKNQVIQRSIAQLRFTGLIPGSPRDASGLAFANAEFSGDYARAERPAGRLGRDHWQVVELTYQWTCIPGTLVQSDLQIIVHSSGVSARAPVLVPGVWTVVTF